MQEDVVGARDLLNAKLSDGSRTIGRITDLVLSEESSDVELVLFEVPYAYRGQGYARNHGFVQFDDIVVETGLDELRVRIAEGVTPEPPEALELSAQEADNRLASSLIGSWLQFSNDEVREIDNLLIDRDTGTLTHYVLDMELDSLFDQNRRMIPAEEISVTTQGYVMTGLTLRDAEALPQEYSQEFL